MSRRSSPGILLKPEDVEAYAKLRDLDYKRYSKYHMRLMDGGYTVLDVWTTGRYYVLTTDYSELTPSIVERGGEKGDLLLETSALTEWLDGLFYPELTYTKENNR